MRWELIGALALDWLAGEPPDALHPVVWLGRLISAMERRAPTEMNIPAMLYGAGMAAVSAGVAVVPALLLCRYREIPPATGIHFRATGRHLLAAGVRVALLKTTFAWRTLHRAGERVWEPLAAGDLDGARAALRWLVSRETAQLDEALIAAAAIESLAENASDSVVAPLLFYALFGLPGACAYRAVNTLDAMIGYRGRYEYLGKVPARLDDLLNLAPARLTALLIVGAAGLCGADVSQAWQVMWRDHACTASPNAGYPMSAMAGALGVRLEKAGHYCLNAEGRAPTVDDLRRASQIVWVALALAAGGVLMGAALFSRRTTSGTTNDE